MVKPFIYDLEEGQTVKVVSSSEDVKLKIKDNQIYIIKNLKYRTVY